MKKTIGFILMIRANIVYANSKEFGKAMYEAGQHSQQARIDELQARIDKTIDHIKDWYGCVELSHIVDILEGTKDEN